MNKQNSLLSRIKNLWKKEKYLPVQDTEETPIVREITFQREDYPKILEAIQKTTYHILDFSPRIIERRSDDWVLFPVVGDILTEAWCLIHGYNNEEEARKLFSTHVLEDGEISVEFKYYPYTPYDAETAEEIYFETKLSDLGISLEEFIKAVEDDAEWVMDVFGGEEGALAFYFEAVPEGFVSQLNGHYHTILNKPLPVIYKGENYNIYIGQDD